MNNLFAKSSYLTNLIIHKLGYKKIFLGFSIINIVLYALNFWLFDSLSLGGILGLFSNIIFTFAIYYLACANIKTYFYFFIFLVLRSYVSIKSTIFMGVDPWAIAPIVIVIIVILGLFFHGLIQWSENNIKGYITPNTLKHSNIIVIVLLVILAIIFVVYFFINQAVSLQEKIFASFAALAYTSALIGIVLVNLRKLEAWIFLFIYGIASLFIFFNVFLIIHLVFVIQFIFAYRFWALRYQKSLM